MFFADMGKSLPQAKYRSEGIFFFLKQNIFT